MSGTHFVSGHWRLGIVLAFAAMLSWATLPVALSVALAFVDPWTLTWFRFFVAMFAIGIWLRSRRMLVWPGRGGNSGWILLVVAAVTLTANYMLYILGLDLTKPAVAQVLIQLAPVLMGLGGIWLFGERYSKTQWAGIVILLTGLAVFLRDQLGAFAEEAAQLWQGALLIVLGAVAWAAYALAQKQMLKHYPSTSIMWFIYVFATLVLLPTAAPTQLWNLSPLSWAIVSYCALNTLVAYGSFAEALNHWEASRVSAVLALTPLGTFAFITVVDSVCPGVLPAGRLDWVSLSAAGLVVAGSIVTSLTGQRTLGAGK